jgi:UDP-N-acetylmuramoylalanine--D-glutamate ligase
MEKRIVILGAGESGSGAAILAKKLGFDVFVSDFGKIADRYKEQLDSRGILWEEQQHTEEKHNKCYSPTQKVITELKLTDS